MDSMSKPQKRSSKTSSKQKLELRLIEETIRKTEAETHEINSRANNSFFKSKALYAIIAILIWFCANWNNLLITLTDIQIHKQHNEALQIRLNEENDSINKLKSFLITKIDSLNSTALKRLEIEQRNRKVEKDSLISVVAILTNGLKNSKDLHAKEGKIIEIRRELTAKANMMQHVIDSVGKLIQNQDHSKDQYSSVLSPLSQSDLSRIFNGSPSSYPISNSPISFPLTNSSFLTENPSLSVTGLSEYKSLPEYMKAQRPFPIPNSQSDPVSAIFDSMKAHPNMLGLPH
jgi:hypothetical protein